MAIEIKCPQCNTPSQVTQAFPGSRITCPACQTLLILDIQVQRPPRTPVVRKSGPQVITPADQLQLREAAITHLGRWLDVASRDMWQSLEMLEQGTAYETWKIPKGATGRFRQITAPQEPLKKIQRRILDRLLYRIPVSNAAHGFVQGRSIVTNAAHHLATAREILNLDLKDAFPSVERTRVKHIFVRYIKIPLKHLGEEVAHAVLDEAIELLVHLCTYNNSLPQGSPTSGYLLNVACTKLDKYIYRLLANHGPDFRYTRYADDLTISAPCQISQQLRQRLQTLVRRCGFQVNPEKISYSSLDRGERLEVTGLILEKGKVRIPRSKLEAFRATIHQASQLSSEELTLEKRLMVHSIVAFVSMVYEQLPTRIASPYHDFLQKHRLTGIRKGHKAYLNFYPKT